MPLGTTLTSRREIFFPSASSSTLVFTAANPEYFTRTVSGTFCFTDDRSCGALNSTPASHPHPAPPHPPDHWPPDSASPHLPRPASPCCPTHPPISSAAASPAAAQPAGPSSDSAK